MFTIAEHPDVHPVRMRGSLLTHLIFVIPAYKLISRDCVFRPGVFGCFGVVQAPLSDNIDVVVSKYISCTVSDDRSQILIRLSLQDPRLQHQGIQDCRVQKEEFRYASSGKSESDAAILFYHS